MSNKTTGRPDSDIPTTPTKQPRVQNNNKEFPTILDIIRLCHSTFLHNGCSLASQQPTELPSSSVVPSAPIRIEYTLATNFNKGHDGDHSKILIVTYVPFRAHVVLYATVDEVTFTKLIFQITQQARDVRSR